MSKDKKPLHELDYLKKPNDWDWMGREARNRWLNKALKQLKQLPGIIDSKILIWITDEVVKIDKENREAS